MEKVFKISLVLFFAVITFCGCTTEGISTGSGEDTGTKCVHRFGGRGFVRDWLFAGPFPSPVVSEELPDGSSHLGFYKDYLGNLGGESKAVLRSDMEILFKDPKTMTYFCFDYMPSLIEVLAPEKLILNTGEMSDFFNDLQARLHQVDMIVKQVNSKLVFLNKNMKALLENFLRLLLKTGKELSSEQLAKMTGVGKNTVEDLLDVWVDEGKAEMMGEKYKLK